MSPRHRSVSMVCCGFDDLSGWHEDNHVAAVAAFLSSAKWMQKTPYPTRTLGVSSAALADLARKAIDRERELQRCSETARLFFEHHFSLRRILASDSGFMTGYFEPVVKASYDQTPEFSVPLLSRPADLIKVTDENRPTGLESNLRFARKTANGLVPYFDRGEIQDGALKGQTLEIAWLQDAVDAFFVHVQGAAKLAMTDGSTLRVTYAAKTGHPYTSLGKILCKRLGCEPAEMTADVLAGWMRQNPLKLNDFLAQNQSYIFFRKVEGLKEGDGPIGAAKVPLIPWRSLAVDRTLHTFGTPIYVSMFEPLPGREKPFNNLMIAHDTGSAIIGPARGDIFAGTGEEAGLIAGRIQHEADVFVLIPKDLG